MSDQENTTGNQGNETESLVGIPTEDGVKNVDPALLASWKDEAFEYLHNMEHNKTLLKELVDTMSESTDIKKGVISKWLKARYEDKIKALSQVTETLEALDSAIAPKAVEEE